MTGGELSPDAAADHRWFLKLLGGVYVLDGAAHRRIEPSLAAVLAYLALRGRTHKYRLAGWLWPEAGETAARANMRQLLRRVRLTLGPEFLLGTREIELNPHVRVDLLDFQRQVEAGQFSGGLSHQGDLLGHLTFDGAPDVSEWLESERERLLQLRLRAALGASEALRQTGQLGEALLHAQHALDLEPLSEEATRQVMTLRHGRGDRGAALQAYGRLEQLLRDRLGVEPLPETQALAQAIRQDQSARPGPRAWVHAVSEPAALPVLVGREQELKVLAQAWQRRQMIFVSGEAGIGKTLLTMTFAAQHGRVLRFEARPGDRQVPYATAARMVRRLLDHWPPGREAGGLPDWVAGEVARLTPDVFGQVPAPLTSAEGRLRFFDALTELNRLACADIDVCVLDDAHFADEATSEFAEYFLSRLASSPQGHVPVWIDVYRHDELPAAARCNVETLTDAGLAAHLHLAPLSAQGVADLLSGLQLPQRPQDHAARYREVTGGNPLFILETVRDLSEAGRLGGALDLGAHLPAKVGGVIAQRLTRLGPAALQMARAAATLGGEFTLDQVGEVLDLGPLAVAEGWDELERAGIVRGEALAHDLMRVAVQAGTPGATQTLLHRGAARTLERRADRAGANAQRIARHYQGGQLPLQAAAWFLKAAQGLVDLMQYGAALALREQAAALYEQALEFDAAFGVRLEALSALWAEEHPAALRPLVEGLGRLATDDAQRAAALLGQATLDLAESHLETVSLHAPEWAGRASSVQRVQHVASGVLAVVHQAQTLLERPDTPDGAFPGAAAADSSLHLLLLRAELSALAQLRDGAQLRARMEAAEALLVHQPPSRAAALLLQTVATAALRQGQPAAALDALRRGVAVSTALGDQYAALAGQLGVATILEGQGRRQEAAAFRRQLGPPGRGPQLSRLQYFNQLRLAANLTQCHAYAEALPVLARMQQAAETQPADALPLGVLWRVRVDLLWMLGAVPECLDTAQAALAHPTPADDAAGVPWIRVAQVHALLGRPQEAQQAYATAAAFLNAAPHLTYSRGLLHLTHAGFGHRPREDRRHSLEAALALARQHDHPELLSHTLALRARWHAEAQDWPAAQQDAADALARMAHAPPRDDYALPWLVFLELPGIDPAHRLTVALAARDWMVSVLDSLPPPYRGSFLARPTQQALLAVLNSLDLPLSRQGDQG